MTSYSLLFAALVGMSAFLAAAIAVVAWWNRDIPGGWWLAALMAAVAIWAVAALAELSAHGLQASLFWVKVQYVGIVVVPITWLGFAARYTGSDDWLTGRRLALLFVVPAIVLVANWTNPWHGRFRSGPELVSYGPLSGVTVTFEPVFWLHSGYSYLLLVLGTWLILRLVFLSEHVYRGQAIGLVTAIAIPWLGNGVFISGIAPPGLDLTMVTFSVSGMILLGLVARYRLFDLLPIAREVARTQLIETMSDAVVVVDERDRIVDCNPAAAAILGDDRPTLVGRHLADVCPPLATAVDPSTLDQGSQLQTELTLTGNDGPRHYDVRATLLERGSALVAGRLISLRDVTEQRRREQRLDVLNRLLRHNLRNELNVVSGTTSLLEADLEDPALLRQTERIDGAVETIVERSEKFSRIVNRPNERATLDLADELTEVVATARREHSDAEIRFDRGPSAAVTASPAIGAAFIELVDNAVEHHDGEPTVTIDVTTDREPDRELVRVRVRDDGPGIPEPEVEPILRGEETPLDHATGVGLWLVTWIVRESGGDLSFEGTDAGTTVTVTIPRAADVDTETGRSQSPTANETASAHSSE